MNAKKNTQSTFAFNTTAALDREQVALIRAGLTAKAGIPTTQEERFARRRVIFLGRQAEAALMARCNGLIIKVGGGFKKQLDEMTIQAEGQNAVNRAVTTWPDEDGKPFKSYAGMAIKNALLDRLKQDIKANEVTGTLTLHDYEDYLAPQQEELLGSESLTSTGVRKVDDIDEDDSFVSLTRSIAAALTDVETEVLLARTNGVTLRNIVEKLGLKNTGAAQTIELRAKARLQALLDPSKHRRELEARRIARQAA